MQQQCLLLADTVTFSGLAGRRLAAALVACLVCASLGCAEESTQGDPSNTRATQEDWNESYAICMRDKGWDVHVVGGQVIGKGFTLEQWDQYQVSRDECASLTDPLGPMTEEQWTELYQLNIAVSECLAELGYETDPPSFQKYMEDGHEWTPITELALKGLASPSERRAANANCPQVTRFDLK